MFGARAGLEGGIKAKDVDLDGDSLFTRGELVKQEAAKLKDAERQADLIDERGLGKSLSFI